MRHMLVDTFIVFLINDPLSFNHKWMENTQTQVLKEVHYRHNHSKCRECILLETFKHNLKKQTVPDHLKLFGIYFFIWVIYKTLWKYLLYNMISFPLNLFFLDWVWEHATKTMSLNLQLQCCPRSHWT